MRVGIKLFDEVASHAPASLTWREVWVLGVLAKEANDGTRLCWPGFDDERSEKAAAFRVRTRCSRSQFYATVKALIEKETIEIARRGQKGIRAEYRLLPLGPVDRDTDADAQGPGSQDTEDEVQRPGFEDTDAGFSVPESESQGPGSDGQCPGLVDSGSRFDAFSVPETGTPSLQSPQLSSSLSPAAALIHAARVVAESDERDFENWIIKTHAPRTPQWWRTVAANGDLAAHAGAWLAARAATKTPAPTRPVADILDRLDAALDAPLPDAVGLDEFRRARRPRPNPGAPASDRDAAYADARRVLDAVRQDDPDALARAMAQAAAEHAERGITDQRTRIIRAAALLEDWHARNHAPQEGRAQ